MSKVPYTTDDYTVAWICPLEIELGAALEMLDEEHDSLPQASIDHNVYALGSINGHNVVLATLPVMGNCPAATVVTQMGNTFKQLRFGLLVGIGGGVPIQTDDGPIRLGHVVVSMPSNNHSGAIQYDHGKAEDGGKFRRTGALKPPPDVLLAAAKMMNFRRRRKREDPLVKHLERIDVSIPGLRKYKYPGKTLDPLSQRQPEGSRKRAHDEDESPKRIIVHRGTIASGEQVIKDAEYRDRLAEEFRVCWFEMEAAGAMTGFPCLVIRGISDYCDASKNDAWHGYAAGVAAACARELFFHMPVDQVKQCSVPENDVKRMIQDMGQLVKASQMLVQTEQTKKISKWLDPLDPSSDHRTTLKGLFEGSGRWLFHSDEFKRWRTEQTCCLWLHGISGCGKTFLSCAIIQELSQRHHDGEEVLYFFFKFSNAKTQTSENLLRSLAFQLYQHCPDAAKYLDKFYEQKGIQQPDIDSLWATFSDMVNAASDVTIVLDALDECTSLEDLLPRLPMIKCRILMTSRKMQSIQEAVPTFDRQEVLSFRNDLTDRDIRAYVKHKLHDTDTSKLAKRWQSRPDVLNSIETKIMEKAGGMEVGRVFAFL